MEGRESLPVIELHTRGVITIVEYLDLDEHSAMEDFVLDGARLWLWRLDLGLDGCALRLNDLEAAEDCCSCEHLPGQEARFRALRGSL